MFLNLLFPNRCIECSKIISAEDLVCELCFRKINFTHHQFGGENQLKQECKLLFPIENAFALMQFEKESLSRKIVHSLKYGNREKVGKILADWTKERISFGQERPDLITTVPLHPKKLKERGYNQLHLFADVLSQNFKIPCDHQLLRRNLYKKAQAKKSKSERVVTDDLFSVRKAISGKHILIIDDVFTTGNTMSSVAWEILKNSGNRVSILVIALDE